MATLDQLETEIASMLEMSDEDRAKTYGTHGWKMLIVRYIGKAIALQRIVDRLESRGGSDQTKAAN